eukprot:TRINITY_DN40538_c0_g1_i1.p1 TRINITY_DN40538_c0_g1~~TRINITY_DN40538_c0_g1_i1.p1  ORF type:complete len:228 (-),score=23.99 TRINITY_DN40538_c0_g1_i1:129-812(-)
MSVSQDDVHVDMKLTLSRKPDFLILGISPRNWGIIFAIFAVLYVTFGLVFWGFLSAAIDLRQEDWLKLPSANFGEFDTKNEIVPNWDSRFAQIGFPISDVLEYEEDGKVAEWNRPDSCEAVEISPLLEITRIAVTDPLQRVLKCDDQENRAWTLFPWVAELQSVGNANAVYDQGCGDKSDTQSAANGRFTQEDYQAFSSLASGGRLTRDDLKFACLNVVPKEQFLPV